MLLKIINETKGEKTFSQFFFKKLASSNQIFINKNLSFSHFPPSLAKVFMPKCFQSHESLYAARESLYTQIPSIKEFFYYISSKKKYCS